MFDRLEALEHRLAVLNRKLSDPEVLSGGGIAELSREHHQVSQVVEAYRTFKELDKELEETRELLQDEDAALREMAREEVASLEARREQQRKELQLLLLPTDPYEGRPILLEIRAGTGGDEAALFASDLLRMYERFGESQGLRFEVLSASPITVGGGSGKTLHGLKEVVCSVSGNEAYNLLRFESGVHRVQRVPATESQGRIHTSAATVAVLPEPDEVEVELNAQDLEIHTMRAGGPGGQSVNTTDSAVRIVHLPTGITVQCQDEKSQLKNKNKAMRVLKARVLEAEQAARHAEEAAERRAQVGSGDRSERIRTYNFPQNRLTDHRINLTLYKLDQIIDGSLQELITPLRADHRARLLAEHTA